MSQGGLQGALPFEGSDRKKQPFMGVAQRAGQQTPFAGMSLGQQMHGGINQTPMQKQPWMPPGPPMRLPGPIANPVGPTPPTPPNPTPIIGQPAPQPIQAPQAPVAPPPPQNPGAPQPIQQPIQPSPVDGPVQQPEGPPTIQGPGLQPGPGPIGSVLDGTMDPSGILSQHPGWTFQMFGSSLSPAGYRDENGRSVNPDGTPNLGGRAGIYPLNPADASNLPPGVGITTMGLPTANGFGNQEFGTPEWMAQQGIGNKGGGTGVPQTVPNTTNGPV